MIVADPDAHYRAAPTRPAPRSCSHLETKDYGGRGYTCRDLEGHLWSFGSYDPWATALSA